MRDSERDSSKIRNFWILYLTVQYHRWTDREKETEDIVLTLPSFLPSIHPLLLPLVPLLRNRTVSRHCYQRSGTMEKTEDFTSCAAVALTAKMNRDDYETGCLRSGGGGHCCCCCSSGGRGRSSCNSSTTNHGENRRLSLQDSVSGASVTMFYYNDNDGDCDHRYHHRRCGHRHCDSNDGKTQQYQYHHRHHNNPPQDDDKAIVRLYQASFVPADPCTKKQYYQVLSLLKVMTSLVVGSLLVFYAFNYQHHHQIGSKSGNTRNSAATTSKPSMTASFVSVHDHDAISDIFLTTMNDIVANDDDKDHVDNNNDDNNRRTKILTALKNLDEEIDGDIVLMSNKTKFLVAAQVWQSSVQPPLAVIEASSVKDVSLALPILAGLQRDYNVPFRVRSGGHTYMSDYSNVPAGIVLSLTRMNKLEMSNNLTRSDGIGSDSEDSNTIATVTFQPGVTAEQFMQEVLYKHGYVGIIPSAAGVGMGGFVLGGGYGLQSRRYGLAVDNIIRIHAVLMNGTQVVVQNGDDLFWGLLGSGGANFAVVTDVQYRVYPSNDIKLCASVKLSLEELSRFLQRLGDVQENLAPDFTLTVEGYHPPDNRTSPDEASFARSRKKEIVIPVNYSFTGADTSNGIGFDDNKDDDHTGCVDVKMYWTGHDSPATQIGINYIEAKIAPLLKEEGPKSNANIVYYYFSWSGMSREEEQDDLWTSVWSAQSWNGFLMPKNNTQVVWDDIVSSFEAMFRYCNYATPKITLWGGAISSRLPNETAFPYRSALYSVGVEMLVPDGTQEHPHDQIELINAIWPSIDRHLTGVYINQPMTSLSRNNDVERYSQAYWGTNLNKLMVLKQKYDPHHSLIHEQSIPFVNATVSTTPIEKLVFRGSS